MQILVPRLVVNTNRTTLLRAGVVEGVEITLPSESVMSHPNFSSKKASQTFLMTCVWTDGSEP